MHPHIRRAAASAFAASALALVTACGGGAADEKDAGTSARTPAASPSPPEPTAEPLTDRAAEKVLLADSDLPKGWKRDAELVIDGSEYADPEDLLPKPADATCRPLVELFNTGRIDAGHRANAQAVFLKGDSLLSQDVSAYSADRAERAMAALGEAVDVCDAFDSRYGGGKAKVTTKPLEVDEAGDETIGFVFQVAYGDDMVVDIDFGVVRDGANITNVQNNWIDRRGLKAFEQALAEAAEKLRAAVRD
ncbi:hypothetical protein [Streptomyces sp. CC219B]|uniref:hypothetical protein n=1 Tax=Streptomyces sp. CC219B TaxID=3044574 RepID=UPI0024A8290E|nr:hypothetical protein [Streptomyces sp. CC219B]